MYLTYWHMLLGITVIWIIVRVTVGLINKKVDWKYECKLLTVYASIAIVTRLVYFPFKCNILTEKAFIYASRDIANIINLTPLNCLKERYPGWELNLFGNILMFIPVGMSWPFCFKKLDKVWKTVLAGFGYSLFIELTQLFVFGRSTDIDDLMLNTIGALIGALIFYHICA